MDTFFYWKTTLEFRQQMRELWTTAPLTFNECKNMLIKRDFRLLKAEPIQELYVRYLDALCAKAANWIAKTWAPSIQRIEKSERHVGVVPGR